MMRLLQAAPFLGWDESSLKDPGVKDRLSLIASVMQSIQELLTSVGGSGDG